MNARAFALTGLLMLIPASTLAQTTTPQPSTHQQFAADAVGQGMFDLAMTREYLDDRARQVIDNTSPARVDRAARAAARLEAGDCAGAQALAIQENDRRLARRIGELCQARN